MNLIKLQIINKYITKHSDYVTPITQISDFATKHWVLSRTMESYISDSPISKWQYIRITTTRIVTFMGATRLLIAEWLHDWPLVQYLMCSNAYLLGDSLMASVWVFSLNFTILSIAGIFQYQDMTNTFEIYHILH